MTQHRNDQKLDALEAALGKQGAISLLWVEFLQLNGAVSNNRMLAEQQFLSAQGIAVAHLNDMWYEWLGLQGYTGTIADRRHQWFDNGMPGGGPLAIITETVQGSCVFDPIASPSCTAASTFTGSGLNFTNPPDTWVWVVTGGTIFSGQGTDTIVVDVTASVDTVITIDLTATDSISSDTDQRARNFTTLHADSTIISFTGTIPDMANDSGSAMTPYDADADFTYGTLAPVYTLNNAPIWMSIDANTGLITGTPTSQTIDVGITVTGTNSSGIATSNTFQHDSNIAAGAVLVFEAATYDPVTFEMQLQKTGIGTPTATHASTLYAPDFEGTQKAYVTDEPVWTGGRRVTNYAYTSEDLSNFSGGFRVAYQTGIADPIGGNTAVRITLDGGGNGIGYDTPYSSTINRVGQVVINSIWIRRVSGTQPFSLYEGSGSSAAEVPVTTSWARVQIVNTVSSTAGGRAGFNAADDAGAQFDIWRLQSELLNAGALIASEYIPNNFSVQDVPAIANFANQNGNTVNAQVITEAPGALLPTIPYLQYYPDATNDIIQSSDLSQAEWTKNGGSAALFTEDGLTSQPNTATRITVGGTGVDDIFQQVTGLSLTTFQGIKVWMKAIDTTGIMSIANASSLPSGEWTIDLTQVSTTAFEELTETHPAVTVVNQFASTGTGTAGLRFYASGGSKQVIIGNIHHENAKFDGEIRGIGPLFTQAGTLNTDRTVYPYDVLNLNDDQALYFEVVNSYSGGTVAHVLSSGTASGSYILRAMSGTTTWQGNYVQTNNANGNLPVIGASVPVDQMRKMGMSSHSGEALYNVNVGGTWGTQVTDYKSRHPSGGAVAFSIGGTTTFSDYAFKIRKIQIYDIPSQQDGLDTIDGLIP